MSNEPLTRRSFMRGAAGIGAAVTLTGVSSMLVSGCGSSESGTGSKNALRLGIFTDTTGGIAAIGAAHTLAYKLAIEDINAAGGVLGEKLKFSAVDSESDPKAALTKVRQLVTRDRANILVGGIFSSSRDAVVPMLKQQNLNYVYPMTYEGGACDENLFLTGAVPEQNFLPGVEHVLQQGAKRWVLIGHDYSFPRKANAQARKMIEAAGGEVVAEKYYPLDATDYSDAVRTVTSSDADALVNNLTAPGMFTFYKQLGTSGWSNPVVATGFDATSVAAIGAENAASTIVVLDYSADRDTGANSFAERFNKASGGKIAYAPGLSCGGAYRALRFAAAAVNEAGSTDTKKVRDAMAGLKLSDLPGGTASVGADHHTQLEMYLTGFDKTGKPKVLKELGSIAPAQSCNF